MKILNKSIIYYTISLIISIILFIALVVFITFRVINDNVRNVYIDNNMMIDIQPRINKTLDKLSDIDSFKINGNLINITNNSNKTKTYQIILSPINNNESDIKISIDDYIIRYLNKKKKKDNNYIIYELSLEPTYTSVHIIKVFQSNNSNIDNIKANFKLSVKIIE